jgi:Hint domain
MPDAAAISPCFTPGTLIATERGQRPVETLRQGDKVVTRDDGLRRIYWAGRRTLSRGELDREGSLRPIMVRAGAFGEGCPARDMIVSPNHRFLVGRNFSPYDLEVDETLIAARHLVDCARILPVKVLGVSYVHILCDRHQVILADGVWTETFHPDDAAMRGLGNAQRLELLALFPEIETMGAAHRFPAARPILERLSRFDG